MSKLHVSHMPFGLQEHGRSHAPYPKQICLAATLIFCSFSLPGCGGGSPSSIISNPPPPPPSTFTIGGTMSGLPAGSSVSVLFQVIVPFNGFCAPTGQVLSQAVLTVTSNGSFTSPLSYPSHTCYNVTVTPGLGQECDVGAQPFGFTDPNVTNIQLTCPLSDLSNFAGPPDGAYPQANLMQGADGNFYGTTDGGGSGPCTPGPGCGTVFRLTPAGVETILWNFGSEPGDGESPTGTLIQGADGSFYGTTAGGGANGTGTVFKLTPDGTETVLWSFGKSYSNDGNQPTGTLVQDGSGNLYGVTTYGGAYGEQYEVYGFGTVFRLTPTGAETVLWSFGGLPGDGRYPNNLLQTADGNLYGTTYMGGQHYYGTIFKLTPAGAESVLWSFGDVASDGLAPTSLIEGRDGNLYGTTRAGGNAQGTVFQFSLAPVVERSLIAFGPGASLQQYYPASLIQGHDGNFYGVTQDAQDFYYFDCGSIFEVTPDGVATTLWSFQTVQPTMDRTCDGPGLPLGLVQGSDGNFYGMTASYGARGYGSIFKLVP